MRCLRRSSQSTLLDSSILCRLVRTINYACVLSRFCAFALTPRFTLVVRRTWMNAPAQGFKCLARANSTCWWGRRFLPTLRPQSRHKYYKNSFLTIVAANASPVDDGFLSPSLDAVVCDVPYAKSGAILYTARLSYNTKDLDQTESMAASKEIARASVKTPISMRGWCFQEAVLSRRTLRFGSDRVERRC
jgi:hypothetical protein